MLIGGKWQQTQPTACFDKGNDFLDKGDAAHLIFPDFSNVFDTVPRGKSLVKMEKTKISMKSLMWVSNRLWEGNSR